MVADQKERQEATNPSKSFLIQAPAGSGKTEILTQRYLRLLGLIDDPKKILALTFTKKAAYEMRQRIITALQQASEDILPPSFHQQITFQYAKTVLARSKLLKWNILETTSQLRIMTLDAFCQLLVHSIPLLEKTCITNVTEKPQQLYKAAVNALIDYTTKNANFHFELETLLFHLDNRLDLVIELLCQLLHNREQWLYDLYSVRNFSKSYYEANLATIELHAINRLKALLPAKIQTPLFQLVQQIAELETDANSPRNALLKWDRFEIMDRQIAQALTTLLLTSQNKIRKCFDHHVGLSKEKVALQKLQEIKKFSKELLAELSTNDEFVEQLLKVKYLPQPNYENTQWQMLQALFKLLPLLVAHLQLEFKQQNTVDFTEVCQQALEALGSIDVPSDLSLYLDHTIDHILIDEFQDTSLQQYQLLNKLIANWQENSGKSLFLVGDPMQSIYRFRQAEVGLFLKIKNYGIGNIKINVLTLKCNFRSNAAIVNWINHHFSYIFPSKEDVELGAVSFNPAMAIKAALPSAISCYNSTNTLEEAEFIINQVQTIINSSPNESIAILVRTRSQLLEIVSQLKQHKIPFQGVEVELLSNRAHVADAFTLTESLLFPANRRALLSLLKSPLVGLTWEDIYLLANFSPTQSIIFALENLTAIKNLTNEGAIRCQFFYQIFAKALAKRHQTPLVTWIKTTLQQLHAEHILDSHDYDDLEQYWDLIETFVQDNFIFAFADFTKQYRQLYAQRSRPAQVQIMTIHKAKGLEFDYVILPNLSAKTRPKSTPILRWLKLPSNDEDLFLVSPIKAASQDQCLIYNFIGRIDDEKASYELQRLFYVAVTRAKKQLILLNIGDSKIKNTFRHLVKTLTFANINSLSSIIYNETASQICYKLPLNFYRNPIRIKDEISNYNVDFNSVYAYKKRFIGSVIHEILQWICTYNCKTVQAIPTQLIDFHLQKFAKIDHTKMKKFILQHINNFLSDPIGQWICMPHQNQVNEYELITDVNNAIKTYILDRTFIEHGVRWIIDFKIGLDNQTALIKHKQQLNNYAQLIANIGPEPIRCGIYYLTNSKWVSWEPEVAAHNEL